jgi:hypothetical protein
MRWYEARALGCCQGVTEFSPLRAAEKRPKVLKDAIERAGY